MKKKMTRKRLVFDAKKLRKMFSTAYDLMMKANDILQDEIDRLEEQEENLSTDDRQRSPIPQSKAYYALTDALEAVQENCDNVQQSIDVAEDDLAGVPYLQKKFVAAMAKRGKPRAKKVGPCPTCFPKKPRHLQGGR